MAGSHNISFATCKIVQLNAAKLAAAAERTHTHTHKIAHATRSPLALAWSSQHRLAEFAQLNCSLQLIEFRPPQLGWREGAASGEQLAASEGRQLNAGAKWSRPPVSRPQCKIAANIGQPARAAELIH